MARPRFDEIKARLDACDREHPPDREAFLNETCASDTELRAQANWLYEQRFGGRRASLAKVGPYELEREIGRGGMGVVYLASRADDQFERRVAIKLLHPGVDSGNLIERFRNERQILAHLDHPHICRLFDGGVGEDGELYLVMEYVRGAQSIDQYCDQQRLAVRERVRLFLQVCDAVQHAHRLLIVHRDLKPDNILVSSEGQVKLMDFGLAKNLFEPLAVRRMLLNALDGSQPMTPAYASPEQVLGQPIGTSTDIYSLGVILFELLTGCHPFDLQEKESLQDLLNAIPKREIEAPSARVQARARQHGVEFNPVLENRRAKSARALARELRGDLDWIVLAALRKEPDQRYASAGLLREDLQRYLDGAPVRARPDSWGYRTRKLVHRHTALVSAVLIALLLSVGFAITTAMQARRLARERDMAETVSALLVNVFRSSDPDEEHAGAAAAREALAQATAQVLGLDRDPEVQSRLLLALGGVYRGFGDYQRAKPLVVRSLSIRRAEFGDGSLPAAEAYRALGEISYELGEYLEAERALRRSLEIRRRFLPAGHEQVADSLGALGVVLDRRGQAAEAAQALEEAIRIRARNSGESHEETLRLESNLGLVYFHRDDYSRAQDAFRRILERRRQTLGPRHHRVALTLNRLGQIALALGDSGRAEKLLEEALAIQYEKLRPGHPLIALTLNHLAALCEDRGDFARAEQLSRSALDLQVQHTGFEHAETAVNLSRLAGVFEAEDRLEEAEGTQRQALAIREKIFGPEHLATAQSQCDLARILGRLGRHPEAEVLAQRGLSVRISRSGPRHEDTAGAWHLLGDLADWRGEWESAVRWHQRALELRRAIGGPLSAASSALALGGLFTRHGRADQAEPLIREALEIRSRLFRPGNWQIAEVESRLGECLMIQKRYPEAMGLLTRSDAVLRKRPPSRENTQALERLAELRRRFR